MTEGRDNQPEIVQTDRESQEFGVQHGQDITGHDSGTSSPTDDAQENDDNTNPVPAPTCNNE